MAPRKSSFAKFMFETYGVVVVPPLSEVATNLKLLDILIQPSKGLWKPVLERAGSMVELGSYAEPGLETEKTLRELLKEIEEDEGSQTGLFKWIEGNQSISETFKSAKCLTGSILTGVADVELAPLSKTKTLTCTLENLRTACVDKFYLEDIIADRSWFPNLAHHRLERLVQTRCFPSFLSRTVKMWVVYQLLYVTKVVVEESNSFSPGLKLTSEGVLLPPPLVPGVGGTVSLESNSSFVDQAHSGKKMVLGFRALPFEVDCHKLAAPLRPQFAGAPLRYQALIPPAQYLHHIGRDDSAYPIIPDIRADVGASDVEADLGGGDEAEFGNMLSLFRQFFQADDDDDDAETEHYGKFFDLEPCEIRLNLDDTQL